MGNLVGVFKGDQMENTESKVTSESMENPLKNVWYLERLGNQPMKRILKEGENVIGRSLTSDIHIMSIFASRRHCIVNKTGDSLQLEDLNSFNGTFLNGREIKNTTVNINIGDLIAVGGNFGPTNDKELYVFRLGNTYKDAETHDGAVYHNEPPEHSVSEILPKINVEAEVDDDHQHSPQTAEDNMETPINPPEDEQPMEPPQPSSKKRKLSCSH